MSGRELVRVVCGEHGCGRRLATVTATPEGPEWRAWFTAPTFELPDPSIMPVDGEVVKLLSHMWDTDGSLEVRCPRHPSGVTIHHEVIAASLRKATRPGGTRQKLAVPDSPRPVEQVPDAVREWMRRGSPD